MTKGQIERLRNLVAEGKVIESDVVNVVLPGSPKWTASQDPDGTARRGQG